MPGRRSIKGKSRISPKFQRHGITYKHKLTVVEFYLQSGSMASTVAEFYSHLTAIGQKNKKSQIRKWNKAIDHIRDMVSRGKGGVQNLRRLGVATVLSSDSEKQIVLWINNLRKDGVPVSRAMLREKALEVAADLDLPEGAFTASSNWIKRFLRRHELSFRCRTRQGQTTPPDAERMRVEFCEFVEEQKRKYNVKVVHNAYQTAVFYEYIPRVTVDNTGTKTVWVKCAGRTKERITLMLLADSEGTKYTSYAIFKRKDAETAEMRSENNQKRHGFGKRMWEELQPLEETYSVQIYSNRTAWWNSDMSITFLE